MNIPHSIKNPEFSSNRGTVLVVEDEVIVAEDLTRKLGRLGYQVIGTASQGEEAVSIASKMQPDMILMDIRLRGEMDGVEAAAKIHDECHRPVIYLTAHNDPATLNRAKVTEPYGYILKPFQERELETTLEIARYMHAAEQRLRESEQRCRALADATSDGVVMLDHGRAIEVNQSFLDVFGFGREEILDQAFAELVALPEHAAMVAEHFAAGNEGPFEAILLRKDHHRLTTEIRTRTVSFQGLPVLVASIRDITARRQAEEARDSLEMQLRQSNKMQAMGTLAGGIAHDFNNILTVILGHTELARKNLPAEHPVQASLAHAHRAAFRVRGLVNQILTFSKQQPCKLTPVRLGEIVEEALVMLRSMLPSAVEIRADIPAEYPVVLADSVQIHQILLNLVTNAVHALGDNGGRISVRLGKFTLYHHAVPPQPQMRAGPYLVLEVADNGCGMDAATLERIYEPFFTTREPGKGTGLGLAVVLGIMQKHEGVVTVQSKPDCGTTFKLFFPVANTDSPSNPAHPPAAPAGHGERVLLVDDERAVMVLGRRMLDQVGYQVTCFTEPSAALAAFKQTPQAFDLVITDLTMPQMSGRDLSKELHRVRPDIPVILCTGLGASLEASELSQAGICGLLCKPYLLQELKEVIHVALHPGAQASK
jgi:two-component system, cell cycle sensor histidine kinase and response regulator CckA